MMTREYLRYALMAAALGFGVLIMIVGGMLILPCLFISPFRFLPDNFFITLLAICCGFIGGPYCLLLAVTKLGSWLAAKTPLSCSVSAGLLPLLIATPALAFLPAGLGVLPSRLPFTFKDLDMLDFLLLSACLLAGLLYALFLLAFCLCHRARKWTEMHGEGERSAAASDTGTMARAYRRYLVAAVVVSILFLPLSTLLGIGLWDSFSMLSIVFWSCTPAACGYWLAARAQPVAAFFPGFKPLLLPSLLFLFLSLPSGFFFSSLLVCDATQWMLVFLLTYVLFLSFFADKRIAYKRRKENIR